MRSSGIERLLARHGAGTREESGDDLLDDPLYHKQPAAPRAATAAPSPSRDVDGGMATAEQSAPTTIHVTTAHFKMQSDALIALQRREVAALQQRLLDLYEQIEDITATRDSLAAGAGAEAALAPVEVQRQLQAAQVRATTLHEQRQRLQADMAALASEHNRQRTALEQLHQRQIRAAAVAQLQASHTGGDKDHGAEAAGMKPSAVALGAALETDATRLMDRAAARYPHDQASKQQRDLQQLAADWGVQLPQAGHGQSAPRGNRPAFYEGASSHESAGQLVGSPGPRGPGADPSAFMHIWEHQLHYGVASSPVATGASPQPRPRQQTPRSWRAEFDDGSGGCDGQERDGSKATANAGRRSAWLEFARADLQQPTRPASRTASTPAGRYTNTCKQTAGEWLWRDRDGTHPRSVGGGPGALVTARSPRAPRVTSPDLTWQSPRGGVRAESEDAVAEHHRQSDDSGARRSQSTSASGGHQPRRPHVAQRRVGDEEAVARRGYQQHVTDRERAGRGKAAALAAAWELLPPDEQRHPLDTGLGPRPDPHHRFYGMYPAFQQEEQRQRRLADLQTQHQQRHNQAVAAGPAGARRFSVSASNPFDLMGSMEVDDGDEGTDPLHDSYGNHDALRSNGGGSGRRAQMSPTKKVATSYPELNAYTADLERAMADVFRRVELGELVPTAPLSESPKPDELKNTSFVMSDGSPNSRRPVRRHGASVFVGARPGRTGLISAADMMRMATEVQE